MRYIKKTRFIILISILFVSSFNKAMAQDTGGVTVYNIIKFNPISLAGATMTFAYERVLSSNLSIEITGNFTYTGSNNSFVNGFIPVNGNSPPVKGWGIVPELRYYPLKDKNVPPEGLF